MTDKGTETVASPLDGIDIVSFEHGGVREVFATVVPSMGDPFSTICPRVREVLGNLNAEILDLKVFGGLAEYPQCKENLRKHFPDVDWPMVFVDGEGCLGGGVAGVQIHAVSGSPVETVRLNGRPLGRCFETSEARFLILGDLQSHDPSSPRDLQAGHAVGRLEEALHEARMDLSNVVRTWFYVSDILDWYAEFNAVRSGIFEERGIFGTYVPASTGIGGRNPFGLAVVGSALALQSKIDELTVQEIPSPLQCSPGDYGSSFSRAAEVRSPQLQSVFVSGTASIDETGKTVHLGDVDAQVDQTFRVVEAILESRGMGFEHVTRGNAFFKHPKDAESFGDVLKKFGLPQARLVVSHHDVCRDDLLFEMEVDAVKAGG
jgi:enamine deaminase RidA (YjgF/YER057c/UK114 family)